MTTNRILPKSLHTITVLANLAAFLGAAANGRTTPAEDVAEAAQILGLSGLDDSHGLVEAASKKVELARHRARQNITIN